MAWIAKPSGAYSKLGAEQQQNIIMIYTQLKGAGYTDECVAGVLGNMQNESGLNPWRWQGDTYGTGRGYGLFQYTPASGYINNCKDLTGYSPNTSVSAIVEGATPEDGHSQVLAFIIDRLAKWVSLCWRDYWSTTAYPEQLAISRRIRQQYGANNALTQAQFSKIDNVADAAFAFLACFEGPASPAGYMNRINDAQDYYNYIKGITPPTPSQGKKLPLWMMAIRKL